MKRSIVFAALSAAALTGCNPSDAKLVGVARMSLASVPQNVQCIALSAAGSRQVEHTFDVMPGQPTTLVFDGLPTGSVTFSGEAYSAPCGMRGGASPTWSSDPLVAQVDPSTSAQIHLLFHPNGTANVNIDFEGNQQVGQCTPTMWVGSHRLAVKSVKLPQMRTDYSVDLNGDGRVDNQLGNVVGALTGQNLLSQPTMDAAVASGDDLVLISESSSDPMFLNDACAGATVFAGVKPMTPPRFDGTDQFTVDQSVMPGQVLGPIAMGKFESTASAVLPSSQPIRVTLAIGGALVRTPVWGAHVSLGLDGIGTLNGAIKNSDVQSIVVPAVADGLNATIAADPNGSTAHQLLNIFDNGGRPAMMPPCNSTCQNPDGTCGVAMDGKLQTCEVATNGIVMNVLAPDVEMFAADGSYKPNPNNTNKNAFSIGLGISTVQASF
jgi:hypothetical protein